MSEAAVSILSKMSMYRNNWKNIVITHPGNHKISYMANKNQNYQGNSKVSMAAMKFFFVCVFVNYIIPSITTYYWYKMLDIFSCIFPT
jgi:hypothetical protein